MEFEWRNSRVGCQKMHLKRLEIQGFKSFPEKLSMEFGAGITTVVGPNGSGKSNISDAIRWVLGEQSAKSLRGGKMEDVIFVGTESRRPVGFAEVSIVIDNEENALPVEFREVMVTRRLYRSGESEYFINMAQCRLKDIHQLFFDTGIGVDGYSVIGQGQVDNILSGKVEERRAIFEEASGIMKYKTRKVESERKLVLTTQNIERITDIINELELQVEPLSEQSETARKYLALKEELKDYEISVYVDSITKYTNQKEGFVDKYTNVSDSINEQTYALENIKVSNEEKGKELSEVESKLEEIRNKYYENEKLLSEQTADIKVTESKITSIEENNERLKGEIEEETKNIFQTQEDKKANELEVGKLEADRVKEEAELKELEDKNAFIMNLMSQRAKNVETLRVGMAAHNKEHSEISGRLSAMNQIASGIMERKVRLESDIGELKNETAELENIKKTNTDAENEFTEKGVKLQEEKNKFISITENTSKRLLELKDKVTQLSSEYQFKSSKLNLLSDMDEKMDGYQRSVKEVLAGKGAFTRGIKGTVAQLIETDKKYEIAVETSLGQAFQYIVTDTENTAKDAIEYLRENKLGRATFLPVTAANGKALGNDIVERLKTMKGYIGLGHEIITYDAQYKNVMLSQLGKVAITDNIDNAVIIAKEFRYGFKIITLDGDIIRPSGAMTGGSVDKGTSSGVIGRKREIEELGARIHELTGIIKQMNAEAEQCSVKVSNDSKELSKIETDLRDIEIRLVEINSVKERIAERERQIGDKEKYFSNDIEDLDKELEKISGEIEETKELMTKIENEMVSLQKEIEKCEEDNSSGRTAVDAMNSQLTDKKLAVNNIVHKIEGLQESCSRLSMTEEQSKAGIELKKGEIEQNVEIISLMIEENKKIEEEIREYTSAQTGQGGIMEGLTLKKQTLSSEISGMAGKIADISKSIYLLQEEYNRLEVRKTKIEADEENCRNRLWEDYEITYVNAQEYIKGKELGSFTSMQKYIGEIRDQIRELGDINVNAIEDYKNTKTRLEFLTGQMQDLEESKGKLEKIIYDMSAIMKKQFIGQFELINQSFNSVFRELFDGGRANIIIADMDNVLDSALEIEVQPPGKKLQNMMLLSGGEKALTAIALLFAILKLKPTPFCVLDEIEAALDDTNVIRFADYIIKFADKTQFVLITHRKGTMEASDVIYGVTMEERGISKIVSMKF